MSAVADITRDVAPEYWERLLTIFVDGLARNRESPTPMTARPLGVEQFTTAMSRRR